MKKHLWIWLVLVSSSAFGNELFSSEALNALDNGDVLYAPVQEDGEIGKHIFVGGYFGGSNYLLGGLAGAVEYHPTSLIDLSVYAGVVTLLAGKYTLDDHVGPSFNEFYTDFSGHLKLIRERVEIGAVYRVPLVRLGDALPEYIANYEKAYRRLSYDVKINLFLSPNLKGFISVSGRRDWLPGQVRVGVSTRLKWRETKK